MSEILNKKGEKMDKINLKLKPIKRFDFFNNEIEVDHFLLNKPFEFFGIKGCDNLLNQFKTINIYKLDDINESFNEIHLHLNHVGQKTVQKFWRQLVINIKAHEVNDSSSQEVKKCNEKKIFFNGKSLIIPKEIIDKNLQPLDFPGAEQAVKIMITNGIKRFRDLPSHINEIGEFEGIGKTKIEKIAIRIPYLIDKEITYLMMKEMSNKEKIALEIDLFDKWINKVLESKEIREAEKIPSEYLFLMKDRYLSSLEGQHLTLEILGEMKGVTRERIRQILKKGDNRITRNINGLYSYLKENIEENGKIIINFLDKKPSFSNYLLFNALEKQGIFTHKFYGISIISLLKEEEFENLIKEIVKKAEKELKLRIFSKKNYSDLCLNLSNEYKLDLTLINKIIDSIIKWVSINEGLLKNTRKKDVVEIIMLQYPKGIEIYKNEKELNCKANAIFKEGFKNERDFSAIASRNDMADKILLWGRGTYIHKDFVNIDKEWIYELQKIAEKWLMKEDFIHVKKLFLTFNNDAKKRSVPNEYALYTLLRKYSLGNLDLIKFPHIQLVGKERQANSDWIIQFIKNNGGEATYHELYNLFVEKRGWKTFTLEHNLFTNEEIIQYKHAHYTLLSNYNFVKSSDLEFVQDFINEELTNKPFITINSVFKNYELLLQSIGIPTKRVLYEILKNREKIKAYFDRYPYIVSTNYEATILNTKEYIEGFIMDQLDIVQRETVEEWILEIFGYNDNLLDMALIKSSNILYYNKGKFGEYVHRRTIGFDEEIEKLVLKIIKEKYEEIIHYKKREYALLEELYNPSTLPELENYIEWSIDLLGDVLKKSGKWNVIGSYDEIFLPANVNIITEEDFIKHVLILHFNGFSKLKDFRSFLSEIRYSKHGQLLSVVEEKLNSKEAEFEIIGDEIHIKN